MLAELVLVLGLAVTNITVSPGPAVDQPLFCWDVSIHPTKSYYLYVVPGHPPQESPVCCSLEEMKMGTCMWEDGCPPSGFNAEDPWECSEGTSPATAGCAEGRCCFPFYVEPTAPVLYLDIVERDEVFDGSQWTCFDAPEEHGPRNPCTCHS